MPRKKITIQERQIRKLTTDALNALGAIVSKEASRTSKVLTGDLRDSQNYRVRPFNVLTVSQNWYGKGLFLRGKYSGQKNALMVSVKKNVPEATKIYIKDMVDLLKSPIVTKTKK